MTINTIGRFFLINLAHGDDHQGGGIRSSGLELLRSAAAEGVPYDLAVLDLMMPGMDGFRGGSDH